MWYPVLIMLLNIAAAVFNIAIAASPPYSAIHVVNGVVAVINLYIAKRLFDDIWEADSLVIVLVVASIMWLALTGCVAVMSRDFWRWGDRLNAVWGPCLWLMLNLLILAVYLNSKGH